MSDGHQSLIHETLCRVHLRENFDTLTTARNVAVMNRVAGSFCWDPHAHTRPQLLDDDDIVLKMASVRSRISGWRVHRSICRCPATATLGSGSKNRWTNHSVGDRCCQFLAPVCCGYARYVTGKTRPPPQWPFLFLGSASPLLAPQTSNAIGAFFAGPQNVIGVASELAD